MTLEELMDKLQHVHEVDGAALNAEVRFYNANMYEIEVMAIETDHGSNVRIVLST